MQHKLKVLFDMARLAVSGTDGTGVVHIADILLKKLSWSAFTKQIEQYVII